MAHGLSAATVYYFVDDTIAAIDCAFEITFPYQNEEWLQVVSDGFARGCQNWLQKCCGALDGIAIKIMDPSARQMPNSSSYYNRKGWFALSFQAMCDSKYHFTFFSCIFPDLTHDSTAYTLSNLSKLLSRSEKGLLPSFWVAADDAYTCMNRLLTPWPGRNLIVARDFFNYWLSSARINIEQRFGMLVERWGVLWRPLRCSLTKNAKLVFVSCKLHNFIIDSNEPLQVPYPSRVDIRNHTDPEDRQVYLQDDCDLEEEMHRRRRDLVLCRLRERFTDEIEASEGRRPNI